MKITLVFTAFLILLFTGCKESAPILKGAQREKLLSSIKRTPKWLPKRKAFFIPEDRKDNKINDAWVVDMYPEENGEIIVTAKPEIFAYWPTITFINGQLSMISYDTLGDHALDRYFFFRQGKLIHTEKQTNHLVGETYPSLADTNELVYLEELTKGIPAEVYTLVSNWQTGHRQHQPLRQPHPINLQYMKEKPPIQEATELFNNEEFYGALKSMCAHDDWLLTLITQWMEREPPVEYFEDQTGLVVRSEFLGDSDGLTLCHPTLMLCFDSGNLAFGYHYSNSHNELILTGSGIKSNSNYTRTVGSYEITDQRPDMSNQVNDPAPEVEGDGYDAPL